jgi:hypothetical protein
MLINDICVDKYSITLAKKASVYNVYQNLNVLAISSILLAPAVAIK